jgi:hypothetical protein
VSDERRVKEGWEERKKVGRARHRRARSAEIGVRWGLLNSATRTSSRQRGCVLIGGKHGAKELW